MENGWKFLTDAIPCTAGQEVPISQKRPTCITTLYNVASVAMQNRWQNVWIGQQYGDGQGQYMISYLHTWAFLLKFPY